MRFSSLYRFWTIFFLFQPQRLPPCLLPFSYFKGTLNFCPWVLLSLLSEDLLSLICHMYFVIFVSLSDSCDVSQSYFSCSGFHFYSQQSSLSHQHHSAAQEMKPCVYFVLLHLFKDNNTFLVETCCQSLWALHAPRDSKSNCSQIIEGVGYFTNRDFKLYILRSFGCLLIKHAVGCLKKQKIEIYWVTKTWRILEYQANGRSRVL